ncbi:MULTISPECIES: flavin-containing monooxygenase [Bacillaceae]|uniref:flavin-containing monooxygenase n=1 Tax=Bacillaceae TaxID=186817 RepID=UPI0018DB7062|nr:MULTISPECIES: NAD(P)/FAD-dependent oxidoreductase [Rossellomorea]MBH9965658.1 NAD(P)-binding domain-containing protein [[Bacillus] enclensis]MBW3111144.1 NAD(P)/FAD-dependent oxidoreductase [Bacillus sp. MCCB 382]MDX8345168.1 NAD(P)/FAD-dependent oxidoreductase [Rossellomorea sp. YZS02]
MKYDVIIIGGGQAGLSMGYYLKKSSLSYLILDELSEIGEVWKNRYDSLQLFTPSYFSSLPGFNLDSDSYPTKDDVADYLKQYVKRFSLPLQMNTKVNRLFLINGEFVIETNQGSIKANNVVVATGPFQKPYIPDFSSLMSKEVLQIHSSEYKNPSQLKPGTALVVGGGNSGAQIADELSKDRKVFLSVGHKMVFLPQDVGNKSIFWYLDKLGVYKASHNSLFGKMLKKRPDPIFGYRLKRLIKNGTITLKPRAISSEKNLILFEDKTQIKVDNVVWATGYKPDYNWIELNEIFNDKGFPTHNRGVTSQKGLFFLGLPWQHNRSSVLIQGVGEDASYIYTQLKESNS